MGRRSNMKDGNVVLRGEDGKETSSSLRERARELNDEVLRQQSEWIIDGVETTYDIAKSLAISVGLGLYRFGKSREFDSLNYPVVNYEGTPVWVNDKEHDVWREKMMKNPAVQEVMAIPQDEVMFFKSIGEAINNSDTITTLVAMVIGFVESKLSEEQKEKVHKKVAENLLIMISKWAVKSQVVIRLIVLITSNILASAGFKQLVKRCFPLVITAFSIYGTIEMAKRSSDKLKREHPQLYAIFHERNVDLLYMFIEPHVANLVNLCDSEHIDDATLEKIINELIKIAK